MVFTVCYDLRKPDRDYPKLEKAIRTYVASVRVQESVWLIISSGTAENIRDHLVQYVDKNDALFVGRFAHDLAWRKVSENAQKWLEALTETHFK